MQTQTDHCSTKGHCHSLQASQWGINRTRVSTQLSLEGRMLIRAFAFSSAQRNKPQSVQAPSMHPDQVGSTHAAEMAVWQSGCMMRLRMHLSAVAASRSDSGSAGRRFYT